MERRSVDILNSLSTSNQRFNIVCVAIVQKLCPSQSMVKAPYLWRCITSTGSVSNGRYLGPKFVINKNVHALLPNYHFFLVLQFRSSVNCNSVLVNKCMQTCLSWDPFFFLERNIWNCPVNKHIAWYSFSKRQDSLRNLLWLLHLSNKACNKVRASVLSFFWSF